MFLVGNNYNQDTYTSLIRLTVNSTSPMTFNVFRALKMQEITIREIKYCCKYTN